MTPLRVVVEADGGARGNPGPAGYGAVVRDANSGEVLAERGEALGIATNNVAEYSGLLAGLRAAADLGAAEVEVRMDSKLVVEQMSGRWQIKNPGLRPLAAQAATLVRRFDLVTFVWIPRERNKHADALANKAMDEAAGVSKAGRGGAEGAGKERRAAPAAGAVRPSWEPPVATPTRLLLVRHGATELTAQRRYSGRGDVPLSDVGLAQARATAARVKALAPSVAAVVSSPLSRCTGTAEVIAATLGGGVPVTVEPDLVECDFGAWEGKTFTEVRAEWPDEMDAWLGSTEEAPPGGESFRAVATRVRRVVATLHKTYPESTLVVVSHVSPLKILLRDALAAGDAFLHRLYLDPAGLSIVDMWADGGVAVRMVNETAHLS
ncbi:bifunctional RNase H/acid phosphatase [Phytohabitans flavus]|uniref:Bifunctional RNase H/acid phosphatase n=1 Tax=Phytohabitans flavus TaxID=1076124 RepID=A0A6F8XYS0_9ACTN|nr:bifunctional RNase H/acid phosphatase [Phytohabitans flavus]BCB79012.1 bifunctional RNase H/acid phosphatase [Phytohabitans flavus]